MGRAARTRGGPPARKARGAGCAAGYRRPPGPRRILSETARPPRGGPSGRGGGEERLPQLLFDELDVLADLGVVLLHPQLLRGELLVLVRRVEVAGAGGRNQLDLLAHLGISSLKVNQ